MKCREIICILLSLLISSVIISLDYIKRISEETYLNYFEAVIDSFFYEINNKSICRITNLKYCVEEAIRIGEEEIYLYIYKKGRHVNCGINNKIIDITSPRFLFEDPEVIVKCKIITTTKFPHTECVVVEGILI